MDAGWFVFILFCLGGALFFVYERVKREQDKRRLLAVLDKYGDRTSMELRREHGFDWDVYLLLIVLEEDGEIISVWKESRRFYRRVP